MNLLKIRDTKIVNLDYMVEAKYFAGVLTLRFAATNYYELGEEGQLLSAETYSVKIANVTQANLIWEHLQRSAAVL